MSSSCEILSTRLSRRFWKSIISKLWGVLVVGIEGLLLLFNKGVLRFSDIGRGVEDHFA